MRRLMVIVAVCLFSCAALTAQTMPNATPMPFLKAQFFSSSGVPLAAGKLYFYTAGTVNALDTYTTSCSGVAISACTANTNPVVLDAGGRASVFFGPSCYKIIAQNALSVQQWTEDNICDIGALISTGHAIITLQSFTQSGLPAAGTDGRLARVTDQARGVYMDNGTQWFALNGRVANVREFGAKGDGITSDYTAISAAASTGLPVLFPCGTYSIGANTLTISTSGQGLGTPNGSTDCATLTGSATQTLIIDSASNVTVMNMTVANTNANGRAIQLNTTSADANLNKFLNMKVAGNGRGATGATNTSSCYYFNPSGGHNTYYNEVLGGQAGACNTAINLSNTNANGNQFIGMQLNNYWTGLNFGGVDNVVRGFFLTSASGNSATDPTVFANLSGGASTQNNDIEIPTGEPGTSAQAVVISASTTHNRLSNICILNYDLGINQATGAFANAGTANAGVDQPECSHWSYRNFGLSENHTYRLGSFTLSTSNSAADVIIQWDSRGSSTACSSGGWVHAFVQNAGGTVTVKPLDATEQQQGGGGCASFSGWDVSGTTLYPVFFQSNNGTATVNNQTNVAMYTSDQAGVYQRLVTDKGVGNVAPTTTTSANANTAQGKGHLSGTASLNFAAFAGNDCQDLSVTVAGAADGDVVVLGIPLDAQLPGTMWNGFITAANTVNIRQCKVTAGASADPPAATIRADVWHY